MEFACRMVQFYRELFLWSDKVSLTSTLSYLLLSAFVMLVKHAGECSANIEIKFPGSCDFETADLCDYVQGKEDDFDWQRRTGPTPSQGTGPRSDHTLGQNGTGHYMYIEGTGVHSWSAAHLISPALAPLEVYCVSFFYHMHGEHAGQLSVLVLDEATPQLPGDIVWSVLWEQGDAWLNASVNVRCDNGCKLSFEAKPGNGFWSDTALDDITVTNGSCFPQGIPETSPTPYTTDNAEGRSSSTGDSRTSSSGAASRAPQQMTTPTLGYEIIEYKYDEHFITIILAVGLSFWTVVFGAIFVLFCLCDRHRGGGRSRGPIYNVQVELSHPEKRAFNTDNYVEIDERENEEIEKSDINENEEAPPMPERTEDPGASDTSSVDSERYSVPVIAAPKPPRGPSPPCGYMSLQLDSLNNNEEYQPLNVVDVPEIEA